MRRRTQDEMDQLVAAAGFAKIDAAHRRMGYLHASAWHGGRHSDLGRGSRRQAKSARRRAHAALAAGLRVARAAGPVVLRHLWLGALGRIAGARTCQPIVFDWERHIPFLAVDRSCLTGRSMRSYGLSLFLCRDRDELDTHAAAPADRPDGRDSALPDRAVAAHLHHRPTTTGIFGPLFAALRDVVDKPFNQAPSLHIALLVILWAAFRAMDHRPLARGLMHVWALLIGMSVLTTWQHHFIDVPTGALLGLVLPLALAGRTVARRSRIGASLMTAKRRRLCAYYAAARGAARGIWLDVGRRRAVAVWPRCEPRHGRARPIWA